MGTSEPFRSNVPGRVSRPRVRETPGLSPATSRAVSPTPAKGPLARARRVPFRKCRLSRGEFGFPRGPCPAGFVSSSGHLSPLPWAIRDAGQCRRWRQGGHGKTDPCRPCPRRPHREVSALRWLSTVSLGTWPDSPARRWQGGRSALRAPGSESEARPWAREAAPAPRRGGPFAVGVRAVQPCPLQWGETQGSAHSF